MTPEWAERFWVKVAVGKPDECWLWTASAARGYGQFRIGTGAPHKAHRLAYELHKGPIPGGKVIDHICRTPPLREPEPSPGCLTEGEHGEPQRRPTIEQSLVKGSRSHMGRFTVQVARASESQR